MDDSWSPQGMRTIDHPEAKAYLACLRENNPLSDCEKKTRDFYIKLFAEHFSSECADGLEVSEEPEAHSQMELGDSESEDISEKLPSKSEDISGKLPEEKREDGFSVKLFVEACEKNSLEGCLT